MRKLSYISGTSNKPLIGQTIGVFFDHIVEKYPDNLAVISRHQNIRWTYEKLQIEVNLVPKALEPLILEKGIAWGFGQITVWNGWLFKLPQLSWERFW